MKQQFRLFIVTFIFAGAVIYLLKDQKICMTNQLYSGLLGNILAALFAAFMVWVAWEQWSKLSQTSSADFIHRLTKDFFTAEARTVLILLECKALRFVYPSKLPEEEISDDCIYKSQPYFIVDHDILIKSHLPKEIIDNLTKKSFYSAWEIDDFLLSPLEDVGMLESKGIVAFHMVHSGFSYYLRVIWENNEIRKYINSMREENKSDGSSDSYYYGYTQYITIKCEEYENLHDGLCNWWWLFKRQFCGISPKLELELAIEQ